MPIEQRCASVTHRSSRSRQGGFTLIEAMISLFVLSIVIIFVLRMFDMNSKIARAQIHLADLQQSVRVSQYSIVRLARMAGRGGLPSFQVAGGTMSNGSPYTGKLLPGGPALEVRNDVPTSGALSNIVVGDGDSPKVLARTDVITVRGVINGRLYQVNTQNPGDFDLVSDTSSTPPTAESGKIVIHKLTPSGAVQDLNELANAIADGKAEALILMSKTGGSALYSVVELDTSSSVVNGNINTDFNPSVELAFFAQNAAGGSRADNYVQLGPGGIFPQLLNDDVAMVGILEEYRYYVEERHVDPLDPATELTPILNRARFFPNTEEIYVDDPSAPDNSWNVAVADNIMDLQIAFGIDTNNDGRVTEDPANPDTDEWIGNHINDDPTSPSTATWNESSGGLLFARITTLGRTDREDWRYDAPPIASIEDHTYGETVGNAGHFRRRRAVTMIDLRNL